MKSLKIGHYTNAEYGTGISVFLFTKPGVGVYQICGSSPATRELHTLELDANVEEINGLVFSGGSAFGLGVVEGVMRFLQEQGQGKRMPHGGVVPIVPAAAIYDLAVTSAMPPTAEDAYQACLEAEEDNVMMGRIGAGTGASVGKVVPNTRRMSGGLGHAKIEFANGLIVEAYAVVNAIGDVLDAQGNIIAGACLPNGKFANCEEYLLSGSEEQFLSPTNTSLVAVFTNAKFTKSELKRISKMAVAGMGRAISPVFTRYDGDMIICVSLGDQIASELTVGAIATEVIRRAMVNAVQDSIML